MKKGSFVSDYQSNEIFLNLNDQVKNRDNFFCNYYVLRNVLLEHGLDLSTDDINHQSSSDLIVVDDVTRLDPHYFGKKYLNLMESDIVKFQDFLPSSHINFDKVFTWSDDLVDLNPKKYIKTNYSFCFPSESSIPLGNQRNKLCVMIAGNKGSSYPNELYSERFKAITWFEENRPLDFDLYGIDWNKLYIRSRIKLLRLPNRIPFLREKISIKRPSYRGLAGIKNEILKSYKFSICYENCSSRGYITEKIFDCFFAGCVPIYLGPPNVSKYIPDNCYINFSLFKTYGELYKYISTMSPSEYEGYQKNIINFLYGPMGYEFSAHRVAEKWVHAFKEDGLI